MFSMSEANNSMWRILSFEGVLFYNYVVANKKSNAADEIFAAFDFYSVDFPYELSNKFIEDFERIMDFVEYKHIAL